RLELDQVHAGRADELIAEDLADPAGRRDHRLNAIRQLRVAKPVDHLLPDEIVVAAIFELQAYEPQRENGVGADVLETRRAGPPNFHREVQVAPHLLGDWPGHCAMISMMGGAGSG